MTVACVGSDVIDLYGIDPFADEPNCTPTQRDDITTTPPQHTLHVLADITQTSTSPPVVQGKVSPVLLKRPNAFTAIMKGGTLNRLTAKRPITITSQPVVQKKVKPTPVTKPVKSEQLYLDAGQTNIGSTQCTVCGLRYYAGEIHDEATHKRVHKKYVDGITYTGYKCERLIHQYDDGDRCVSLCQVTGNTALTAKVGEIIEMMNHELGGSYDTSELADGQSLLLYIRHKKVAGACIVQRIHIGVRMTVAMDGAGDVQASVTEQDEPAVLGVDKIWVHKQYRRDNIASKLVDCARETIEYGCTVAMTDVAFSQPTNAGKLFAVKYVNSNTFLTYS